MSYSYDTHLRKLPFYFGDALIARADEFSCRGLLANCNSFSRGNQIIEEEVRGGRCADEGINTYPAIFIGRGLP